MNHRNSHRDSDKRGRARGGDRLADTRAAAVEAIRADPEPRWFWRTMRYRCDGGEFEAWRYLEVGCEGPAGPGRIVSDGPGVGRRIVPVPFVAGRCPNEHPMTHVDWARDGVVRPELELSEIPFHAGLFLYPSEDELRDPYACGRPVWKAELA